MVSFLSCDILIKLTILTSDWNALHHYSWNHSERMTGNDVWHFSTQKLLKTMTFIFSQIYCLERFLETTKNQIFIYSCSWAICRQIWLPNISFFLVSGSIHVLQEPSIIFVWTVHSDWNISLYRSHGCSTIEKAHEGSISSCDFSPDG